MEWNGKVTNDIIKNRKGRFGLILCVIVDDRMGLTFNHRRQSQDRLLRSRLLEETRGGRLWINHYTAEQFDAPLADNIIVDEDFLDKAEKEDFCFVENLPVAKYKNRIDKIILFKWNSVYPADTYFDISLAEDGWKLKSVLEFEGNSHKKITREEWENEKQKEKITSV